jgi:cytochrome P450 family 142 subfamily A polypeptide 1
MPQLSRGEKSILLFESADFDEAVFGDPENFRIDRYPNNHMAFGFATHFCLGNQLARPELSSMRERLLQRLPDMRLASTEPSPLRPANFVSGLEKMRLDSRRRRRGIEGSLVTAPLSIPLQSG